MSEEHETSVERAHPPAREPIDAEADRTSSRSEAQKSRVRVWLAGVVAFARKYGRWFLLAVGLVGVVLLIRAVGVEELRRVLVAAGPYLPLVLFFEIAWVVLESGALLALYGSSSKRIGAWAWIEAIMVHYTTMIVLPVGRTGAEVARASMMAPYVGTTRAAASAALMQTFTLFANTIVSFACIVPLFLLARSAELRWLLFGNGVATLVLAGGIYLVMRRAVVGGFLARKFEAMAHFGPHFDEHFQESRSRHAAALGMTLLGRSMQTLQYGVIVLAVTGAWSNSDMVIAHGIHLVGAGLGDMVPNQVGITEGAYRIFAGALDLAAQPEKAVAIALLARISNLSVAGLCALGVQFVPGRKRSRALAAP